MIIYLLLTTKNFVIKTIIDLKHIFKVYLHYSMKPEQYKYQTIKSQINCLI